MIVLLTGVASYPGLPLQLFFVTVEKLCETSKKAARGGLDTRL